MSTIVSWSISIVLNTKIVNENSRIMPVSNNDLVKEIRIFSATLIKLNERLDEMDQKIDKEILDINNQIASIHTSFTKALLEVKNELDVELRALHEKFNTLKTINGNIVAIPFELTIHGISELDGENLNSIISKLSSVINFEDQKSIVKVHRLKQVHQVSSSTIVNTNILPPIIINFNTTNSRRMFHTKYFAFIKTDPLKLSHIGFESHDRIFINENLPKECLEILKKAKRMQKSGKIENAYSFNGQVCVIHRESDDKPQIISHVDDLKKFE